MVGDIYYKLKDYTNAEETYILVLQYKQEYYTTNTNTTTNSTSSEYMTSLLYLAKFYFNQKNYTKAVIRYKEYYELKNNSNNSNDSNSAYHILYNIGNCYYYLNQYQDAYDQYKIYLQKGHNSDLISKENQIEYMNVLYLIGTCCYYLKLYDVAVEHMNKCVEERIRVLQENHTDTCTAMNMLGMYEYILYMILWFVICDMYKTYAYTLDIMYTCCTTYYIYMCTRYEYIDYDEYILL